MRKKAWDGPKGWFKLISKAFLPFRGLLDAEEVDADLPVVDLDPINVLPIAQRAQGLLQRALQVHAGVDELAEAIAELNKVL